MALDKAVTKVQVAEQTVWDRFGGVHVEVKYTFWVGEHGPFTVRYRKGEDKTEIVEAEINRRVLHLRDLGLVGVVEG